MAGLGKVPDWVLLQTKVFTRWINQKFQSAGRQERIENVLTGFGDGIVFGAFLEALSETTCNAKWNKNPKLRVSHVDNINMALEFAKSLGVQVKNFPQATDFLDGQERPVLGFVWACILKFLKFGDDDDDSLNAKDALLMWVQNKTAGYNGVNIEKFPNSFKDGLALCALIHSCRPQLIDFDSAQAGDNAIEAAFDAALRYFELEKYITVDEFKRFDEVSMVVYVSDYYYGIARERKKDRAARRIAKVIKFTKEMDARKVEFNDRALQYRARVKDVEKVLGDRTIDNNMAGAVKRLEDFDAYKRNDKNILIGDQLNLESQYNSISTRLAAKSRPVFHPPEGCTLADVGKTMSELEEAEAERNVALHNELNRQKRLVRLDEQHKNGHARLSEWVAEKDVYLNRKEDVRSVGAAQLQLTLMKVYEVEAADVQSGLTAKMKELGDELVREKYERSQEVESRDNFVAQKHAEFAGLAKKKRAVLEDDLAREIFRADVRVRAAGHKKRVEKINVWIDEKEAYLNTREKVDNTPEAALQVSLLAQYQKDSRAFYGSHVESLKALGDEIRAAKYESALSSWTYEEPEVLTADEDNIENRFLTLHDLHDKKKPVLDDHLAREQHKDKLRILSKAHGEAHASLVAWYNEKSAYLSERPPIDSVAEAQLQLSTLATYDAEKQMVSETSVAQLKADGLAINQDVYRTEYSEYTWEDPSSLAQREGDVDNKLAELDALAKSLRADLDAALAREQEKERLRLQWTDQSGSFKRFAQEGAERAADSIFGYTLPEVQAYKATLDSEDSATHASLADKKKANGDLWSAMNQIGIRENAYCSDTPDTLAQSEASLLKALDARQQAYATELERQTINDRLCKEFADLVNSFSEWLSEQKAEVSKGGSDDMEATLQKVESLIAQKPEQQKRLDPIRDAEQKVQARGVEHNRYTNLSAKDAEVQFDGFAMLLDRKKEMLQELIELAKLRGVTQEEFDEFNSNFDKFDKGTGSVDIKQFKALMYSVGEELSRQQVADVWGQHAAEGGMSKRQYLDYMVGVSGDSDTKENVLDGFKVLNNNDVVCRRENLDRVMTEQDVEYIFQTIPAKGDGHDYDAWTEEIFSR